MSKEFFSLYDQECELARREAKAAGAILKNDLTVLKGKSFQEAATMLFQNQFVPPGSPVDRLLRFFGINLNKEESKVSAYEGQFSPRSWRELFSARGLFNVITDPSGLLLTAFQYAKPMLISGALALGRAFLRRKMGQFLSGRKKRH